MIEHINWSQRAERHYGKIIDYLVDEFGRKRAKQYVLNHTATA